MNILIIVGLPASGKTHYIEEIYEPGYIVLDDFVTPDKIKTALSFPAKRLILSDPFFCKESVFKQLLELLRGHNIEFVFYENNSEQCLINAQTRPDKKVDSFIKILSKEYNPPRMDKKVWKN